jgi:hypothetical protein
MTDPPVRQQRIAGGWRGRPSPFHHHGFEDFAPAVFGPAGPGGSLNPMFVAAALGVTAAQGCLPVAARLDPPATRPALVGASS